MRIGSHLRELSRLRLAVAISALLAFVVAFTSVERVSLVHPGIRPRALELGAATTSIFVDSPVSQATDLGADPGTLTSLTTRADLLGNLMASSPVRTYIGRLLGVPADAIQATTPITAAVPRSVTEPPSAARATDLLASTDHYKLDIQADPTVPIIKVSAEGPSAGSAIKLANAAVEGLSQYLTELGAAQHVPSQAQVQLHQLGPAQGGVVNSGASIEIAMLVFLGVFGICCCAAVFTSRVKAGWTIAKLAERSG